MSKERTKSLAQKYPSIARSTKRVLALFPMTWLGLLVGALSLLFLRLVALKDLDLVVLAMGYGSLSVLALSVLNVLVGALLMWLFLKHPLAHGESGDMPTLETGHDVETGFVLRTLRFLPFVHVRCTWPAYPSARITFKNSGTQMKEIVCFKERGRYSDIERQWDIIDVFGLTKMSLRTKPGTSSFSVLPAQMTLTENLVLQAMLAGDEQPHPLGVEAGDRVDIRRYDPTDPARFIHWKLYARTGKLMTRVPEKALAPARRTLAYFVAGEHDEATSSLARWAIETRAFGTAWRFGADGSRKDSQFVKEALSMLIESASAKSAGAEELLPFLARNEAAAQSGQSSLVLFVPNAVGAWLPVASQVAALRKDRVKVLIGTHSGPARRAPVGASNRVLAFLERALLRDTDSLESGVDQVIAAFRAIGVEPKVIGTFAPRTFTVSERNQITHDEHDPMLTTPQKPNAVKGAVW